MDDGAAWPENTRRTRVLYSAPVAALAAESSFMSSALPLRAAIVRGALISLANWPVVLIEFAIESVYKLALAIPVIGGAFMVALLLGADVQSLLADGVLAAADRMLGPLGQAPIALGAFLAAIGVVAFGGELLMFVVKSGTLFVLVESERVAGEIQRTPVRLAALRPIVAYSLGATLEAARHFQGRAARLAAWLGVVYVFIGSGYALTVTYGFQWAAASRWAQAWPLLVVIATSVSVVGLTAANLVFDLMRVVLITDDCRVRDAARRVRTFLIADARQVLGIFGAMALVLMLATAASIMATAGLTLVAWVPLAGLIVLPLQLAFWIVRGLFFQYAGLATLSAYQTQYRRFSTPRPEPVSWKVHQA